jgi:basic membrane protein A and related proteins
VKFEHCSGYLTDANMDNYFGQIEQPRYLSGIVAGMKTTSDKIGYVAAFPLPEVIRGINAFTLGVLSVNPDAKVYVRWTNTWYGPDTEKEAAVALLNEGCDVLSQHQDSPAALKAAEEKNAFGIGYDNPMGSAAPKAYLTAPVWNWGAYYAKKIKAVMNKTWKVETYWGGMKEGMVALDALSALAPAGAQAKIDAVTVDLKAQGNDYIFKGPLKDQTGAVKVEAGKSMTRDEQMSMSWFVEGVVGEIPSGS